MTTLTFDTLAYARKFEEAGFTRQQAEAQADAMRQQAEVQVSALREAIEKYDEAGRRELAAKADVRESELRLQKEIEKVRAEIERVRAETEKVKYDLLKWQIGGWVALAAIMAKGFNWIGF